jgi:transposase
MSMTLERNRRIPLFFELCSGSTPDVVTLKGSVNAIKDAILKIEIILDRGIISHENLSL